MSAATPKQKQLNIPPTATRLRSSSRSNTPRSVKKSSRKTPKKARFVEDIEQENLLKCIGKIHSVLANNDLDDFQSANNGWDIDNSPTLKAIKALNPSISPSPLGMKSRNGIKIRFDSSVKLRCFGNATDHSEKKVRRSARSKAWEDGRPIRVPANGEETATTPDVKIFSVSNPVNQEQGSIRLAARSRAWEGGQPIRIPANGDSTSIVQPVNIDTPIGAITDHFKSKIDFANRSKAWEDGQPIRVAAYDDDVATHLTATPCFSYDILDVSGAKPQLIDTKVTVERTLQVIQAIKSLEIEKVDETTHTTPIATIPSNAFILSANATAPAQVSLHTLTAPGDNSPPADTLAVGTTFHEESAPANISTQPVINLHDDQINLAASDSRPLRSRFLERELEELRNRESETRYHSSQLIAQAEMSAENERVMKIKAMEEAEMLRKQVAAVSGRIAELEVAEKNSVASLEDSMARLRMMSEGLDCLLAEKEQLRDGDKVQRKALSEKERVLTEKGSELVRCQRYVDVYKGLLAELAETIEGGSDPTAHNLAGVVETSPDEDEDDWLDLDEVSFGL